MANVTLGHILEQLFSATTAVESPCVLQVTHLFTQSARFGGREPCTLEIKYHLQYTSYFHLYPWGGACQCRRWFVPGTALDFFREASDFFPGHTLRNTLNLS